MSYSIKNITLNKSINMDIDNCTITGNTVAYKVEDGNITSYAVNNGKIDQKSAQKTDEIELTDYQILILNEINEADGNSTLSQKDLQELTAKEFEKQINELFELQDIYEIEKTKKDKKSATVKLKDNEENTKNISIAFSKKSFIESFFDKIASFFGKDEETTNDASNKNANKKKDTNVSKKPKMQYSNTPIGNIAKEAGVSENYVKDILFSIEGRNSEADLTPYKDGVGANGGAWTIGYGHCGEVNGKKMTDANANQIKITQKEAEELLANDIKVHKELAISYFGDDFNKAPQSIQDAIVDIVFNKGLEGLKKEGSPTTKLKQDLANGDYAAAAEHMVYATSVQGLKKRNVYRCIMAMNDLSQEDRNKAMKNLENYFQETLTLYKGTGLDETYLATSWENAKKGDCKDFFTLV